MAFFFSWAFVIAYRSGSPSLLWPPNYLAKVAFQIATFLTQLLSLYFDISRCQHGRSFYQSDRMLAAKTGNLVIQGASRNMDFYNDSQRMLPTGGEEAQIHHIYNHALIFEPSPVSLGLGSIFLV